MQCFYRSRLLIVFKVGGWDPLSPDSRISYAQGSNMQISRSQGRAHPREYWAELSEIMAEEIRPKEGLFAELTWQYIFTSPEDDEDKVRFHLPGGCGFS